MDDRRIIILFVKFPQPGQVKTRLARTVGDEVAVGIYRQLVMRLVRMLRRVDVEEVRICFDPAEKHLEIDRWLRPVWLTMGEEDSAGEEPVNETALVFRPQSTGDLGERLESAFSETFRESEEVGSSAARVIAIGSDCIEIDEGTFQGTWKALETRDVVFGPTADGGYYLIGMNLSHPVLFENIPWSTEKTLETSLKRAGESGLKVAVLDEKNDIDTEEDWHRAKAMLGNGGESSGV